MTTDDPIRAVMVPFDHHRPDMPDKNWETFAVLRANDYTVDLAVGGRFTTIGVINGWIGTPATFTPGPKVGATLPL